MVKIVFPVVYMRSRSLIVEKETITTIIEMKFEK